MEPTTWGNIMTTDAYLGDPAIDNYAKHRRISQDAKFREAFFHTLAELELIGYMYNEGKIDKDLIRRGPSQAITEYDIDSKFWIDLNRRQTGDSTFHRELETMVVDLGRGPFASGQLSK
jgi:hypothetical protein